MELSEILDIWKSQQEKIEQSLSVNKRLLLENLEGKIESTLSGLKTTRIIGIIFGIIWCVLMTLILILSWFKTNWFFKSAFIIHIVISASAVILYGYHLVLIAKLNHNQSLINAQEQLAKLRLSNLKTLGLLWLQLPVFSIWYMSDEWMRNDPITFWYVQTPIVILQAFIGLWLYKNLNIKNQNKNWFQWFISKGEFGKIKKANELLNEIESLKA